MTRRVWGAVLALVGAAACVDTSPSSGHCAGMYEGAAIDAAMTPDDSWFYRDDDVLDEDGPFQMKYGAAVTVTGEFDDMPDDRYVGTYPTTDERVSQWWIDVRETGPHAEPTTLTLTKATRSRLEGGFIVVDTGGRVNLSCSFNLRRAYERDTDD